MWVYVIMRIFNDSRHLSQIYDLLLRLATGWSSHFQSLIWSPVFASMLGSPQRYSWKQSRVCWCNVEYQITTSLIFDYLPHNCERFVEFYLVAQAIVKCWDQPRILDLFQGPGEGLVQGQVHQKLIRDRESKFITYVHRCFLCFALKFWNIFSCFRLQPWQWTYLSCMVNLKRFSRFSSPISFFPSWNSPSSGFPSSFCPVFTRHFFSKMVHAEIFWVANSGALR